MRKTLNFFLQSKLHWHLYRLLRGRTLCENLRNIYQLRVFGSQQHMKIGVLLTSFSTWSKENNLVEINLASKSGVGGRVGCNRGLKHFIGSNIGKQLQLWGQAHYRATRKYLERKMQVDEPVECASVDDPLLLYKILHLLFSPLVQNLCALRLQSRKSIKVILMWDLWNFSFFGRGQVSQPNSELCCFVSGS